MNKIIMGLIIVLIVLCTVTVGVYYFITPHYQVFEDENIHVEIPSDVSFKVNNNNEHNIKALSYYTNDSINETEISIFDTIQAILNPNYSIVEPFTGINIISVSPEADHAQDSYNFSKNQIKEDFNKYETIDSSKHNYDGIIYDQNNQTGFPSVYTILIFDDDNMTIKILSATDLSTVIHMAETLKVK